MKTARILVSALAVTTALSANAFVADYNNASMFTDGEDLSGVNVGGVTVTAGTWTGTTPDIGQDTTRDWEVGTGVLMEVGLSFAHDASVEAALHSSGTWLGEVGHPQYLVTFDSAVTQVSMAVTGDSSGESFISTLDGSSSMFAVTDNVATDINVITLTGINTNQVMVGAGSWNDWAGIVSIRATPVPEPATMIALAGLGALALRRKRK